MPLVEIFYSLQGEGLRSGDATVFVRFAGCNCDCWFCDTDFRVRMTLTEFMVLQTVAEIAPDCRWVCLTGGEPTIHDLEPLCMLLHQAGLFIQIETNGTRPVQPWNVDHITVSPKIGQGAALHPWYLEHASEFKHVIGSWTDVEEALRLGQQHGKPILMQPNALEPAAMGICVDAVKANPARCRLSLQTHKILLIR